MTINFNVGCGPRGKDDWVNIDWGILAFFHRFPLLEKILIFLRLFPQGYNVQWPKNLKLHNCGKKLPYPDASVDNIYTSHFLEHLKRYQVEFALHDYYRLLKKGGLIRIVVPDMELIITKYIKKDPQYIKNLENALDEIKEKDGSIYMAEFVNHYFFPIFNKNKPTWKDKLMIRFMRPHQWMYDFELMKALLERVGFKNIQKQDYQTGKMPDIDILDTHPFESLHIEAEK